MIRPSAIIAPKNRWSVTKTFKKAKKKITVPIQSSNPGRGATKRSKGFKNQRARGCGMLNSLEPHWEQTSALRELAWSREQSLLS